MKLDILFLVKKKRNDLSNLEHPKIEYDSSNLGGREYDLDS